MVLKEQKSKKERKKTKWIKGNYFLNQLKGLVKQNPIG